MPQFQGYDPYSAEAEDIERKRKYADLLRQQSFSPIQPTRAGNMTAPIHWTQGAAKMLQGYNAGEADRMARDEGKALSERRYSDRQKSLSEALRLGSGQGIAREDAAGNLEEYVPQGKPDLAGAYARLAMSRDPMLAQMGLQGQLAQMQPRVVGRSLMTPSGQVLGTDPTYTQEQAANREQKMRELEMRLQDQRLAREDRASLSRELAAMRAQSSRELHSVANKPPAGFRYLPNGDLERIPGGPADIKSEADLQRKASGATDVDVALGTLRDAYDRLEQGGGITSTKNNPLENVLPSIASSGVGQAAGKLFGTTNQSARNDIAMARPALLAALMKATGMSAKQMDSNAELKLWLSTATDPTLDVESNRRALANIEKKYLSGGTSKPATPQPGKPIVVDW